MNGLDVALTQAVERGDVPHAVAMTGTARGITWSGAAGGTGGNVDHFGWAAGRVGRRISGNEIFELSMTVNVIFHKVLYARGGNKFWGFSRGK